MKWARRSSQGGPMSSWRHVKLFSRECTRNSERMGLKLDNPPFKFDLNMCECLSARALNKAQTHTTLQLYIKLLLFLSRLTLLSQLRFLLLLFLSRFCLLFLLLPISYSNTRASPISLHQDCRSFKCRSIDHLTCQTIRCGRSHLG